MSLIRATTHARRHTGQHFRQTQQIRLTWKYGHKLTHVAGPRREKCLSWSGDNKGEAEETPCTKLSIRQKGNICVAVFPCISTCVVAHTICACVFFQTALGWMVPRWTHPLTPRCLLCLFGNYLRYPLKASFSLLHLKRWSIISLILCHYGCYLQILKGWYWHRLTHTKCCMHLFFPSFAEVFSLLLNSQTQYDIDWVLSHHSFGGFNMNRVKKKKIPCNE